MCFESHTYCIIILIHTARTIPIYKITPHQSYDKNSGWIEAAGKWNLSTLNGDLS